jgi:hypothetical protein
MGVPTSEVGYTSATLRRGDHEVHKGHVVALERERKKEKREKTNKKEKKKRKKVRKKEKEKRKEKCQIIHIKFLFICHLERSEPLCRGVVII